MSLIVEQFRGKWYEMHIVILLPREEFVKLYEQSVIVIEFSDLDCVWFSFLFIDCQPLFRYIKVVFYLTVEYNEHRYYVQDLIDICWKIQVTESLKVVLCWHCLPESILSCIAQICELTEIYQRKWYGRIKVIKEGSSKAGKLVSQIFFVVEC